MLRRSLMSWRPVPFFKYLLSLTLSLALVALSPGFAAYEAAAAQLSPSTGMTGQTGVAPITGLNNIAIGSNLNTTLAPSQDLRLFGSFSAGLAPGVKVGMAAAPVSPISPVPTLAAPLQALKATALGPSSAGKGLPSPKAKAVFPCP